MIQSNLKSVSILVTIDYFLGKKHIESMLYASTQPKKSCQVTDTVHEPRNTYMYDQTTSVELSHILHVCTKVS